MSKQASIFPGQLSRCCSPAFGWHIKPSDHLTEHCTVRQHDLEPCLRVEVADSRPKAKPRVVSFIQSEGNYTMDDYTVAHLRHQANVQILLRQLGMTQRLSDDTQLASVHHDRDVVIYRLVSDRG
jgi:hypothetical protein